MKHWVLRLIPTLLLLVAGLPLTPAFADTAQTLPYGGAMRSYLVHLPNAPQPAEGFPIILAFHGGGMQGAGMRRLTGLNAVADRMGFVVVYPDGIDRHWNDGRSTISNPQDDVGFVAQVIDRVAQDYPVDRRRVFATGLSNGALFAQRIGCELSDRIAAIASVAGSMPSELASRCAPKRAVSVLQINGTADPIMPYEGGSVADFGGVGEGGTVLSTARTASLWARINRCGAVPDQQNLPPTARLDRTRVSRITYHGCDGGRAVMTLSVAGGGHAWPGGGQYAPRLLIGVASRQIDASQLIAEFFQSQPRR